MAEHNIGFWGGMALLISSITGPGLTTIPLLFQQAGWVTPIISFLLFGAVSVLASLFMIETMSRIRGNEVFEAKVEYSTVAHLYLGRKAHIAMQVLLFLALQSVNISSIIISNQTMDSLLIRLFKKTCAVSFTKGWVCATEVTSSGSPFNTYILFSFGYLISAAMVLPLSVMSLVQNIKFQLASVATLFVVIGMWIYIFAHHGLNNVVPSIGTDQSTLIGFVLGNFGFITTIPSFVNELSRTVSIHRTIIYPIIICVILYIIIGLTGAASFQINNSASILATFTASNESKVLTVIVDILFPVAVLVTSVPVFSIVIRYNLVRGNLCSNRTAIFWASILPWIVIIPLQTKGYLILIMNWASLIFGSTTNFILPLVLYISSNIYPASTLDATGGDVFFLHRENVTSSHTPRRSLNLPRLLTTSPTRDSLELPTYPNISPSIVTVDEPHEFHRSSISHDDPSHLKKSGVIDITEQHFEDHGSSSATPAPLRVVYSPTVSRRPTIGSSFPSPRPSFSDRPIESENKTEDSLSPTTGVSPDAALGVEAQHFRRRSSTLATTSSGSQHLSAHARVSSVGTPYRNSRSSSPSLEANNLALPPRPDHFVAIKNRKWVKSTVVAKVCLVIVSCCVVGNIIYTAVESAMGHNLLG